MCGIAGILNLRTGEPPKRISLIHMLGALSHRGPDESGIYRDSRVGLAHTRLAIIDITSGQQPLANHRQTMWMVYNGELYNYVELREELEKKGHVFRTRSDTEVVVHAWQEWRGEAFKRLNGQWAMALWDSSRRELVLSRDRLGIRPLYTTIHNGRLYFASEIKALFAADESIPRAIDPAGIDQTLTFWTVVAPQSVFRGISELEPGHYDIYRESGRTRAAYWQPRFVGPGTESFAGSVDDATEAVKAALTKATHLRTLRSDVVVGSYLSGGLDSSLVSALCRDLQTEKLHTFSIGFEDEEYDETLYQRLMVEKLGSNHHELRVTAKDIAAVFPAVIRHTERPILRAAPAPLFLLSRMVREAGIKVVLTGEGADELFAGYDIFREGLVRRFWARQPHSRLRPLLLRKLYPYLARSPVAQQKLAEHFFGVDLDQWRSPGFAHQPRWRSTRALGRLLHPMWREQLATTDASRTLLSNLPSGFSGWTYLAQDQYLELTTLLPGYLLSSQGDRMLMAHSIEGRFPFLDPNVVELALSLPDTHKIAVLDEKHVIKRASDRLVSPEILRRPKQPYRAPDALAFVTSKEAWIHESLSARSLFEAGIFDPVSVERLWNKCRAAAEGGQLSNTDNMALVAVLSTQLLSQQMVTNPPSLRRIDNLETDIEKTHID